MAVTRQRAQHGQPDRRGDVVVGERRRVAEREALIPPVVGDEAGGQREQAAAQPLADQQHVGRDPFLLAGEQPPGSAEPRLDLVEDQRDPVAAAERARPGEVARGRNDHAALALDRLEEQRRDRAGRAAQPGLQRVSVAEGYVVDAGRQRTEALRVLGAPRQRQRAERLAVIRAGRGEHQRTSRARANQLQRGLDRLRARAGEHAAPRVPRRHHCQRLAERLRLRGQVGLDHRRYARVERRAHRRRHLRCGVAQRDGAVLRVRVEVATAVRVCQPDALAVHKRVLQSAQPHQPAQLRVVESVWPVEHSPPSGARRTPASDSRIAPLQIGDSSTQRQGADVARDGFAR